MILDLPLPRIALVLTLLLGAGSLTACAYFNAEEAITPRPELLTAEEAGGGELIHPDDYYPGPATACGPDKRSNLPLHYEEGPNYVSYTLGRRAVDLGVWDENAAPHQKNLERMKEELEGDACRLGVAFFEQTGNKSSIDWRVETLDFGKGIVAFRSVYWSVDGAEVAPPNPVKREGVDIYSSARAYGVINGKLVMVRIDDTTVEPPSEAELRSLWNAQAGKVLYLNGLERSKELLTPQSGQVN